MGCVILFLLCISVKIPTVLCGFKARKSAILLETRWVPQSCIEKSRTFQINVCCLLLSQEPAVYMCILAEQAHKRTLRVVDICYVSLVLDSSLKTFILLCRGSLLIRRQTGCWLFSIVRCSGVTALLRCSLQETPQRGLAYPTQS